MEAIYLVSPTESNIGRLIEDFSKTTDKAYKGAHVYFIEGKPSMLAITVYLIIYLVDRFKSKANNIILEEVFTIMSLLIFSNFFSLSWRPDKK